MAKLKIGKRSNWITVFFFQLCVISNNVFSYDESLYIVSKAATLLFFGIVAFRILQRGKIRYNQILLLPIFFTIYCTATILWAYSPNVALSQMVTQVQLFLLLLFTFWALNDGVTVMDYLKAVYVSGFGMMAFMLIQNGGISQYINAMINGERMGGVFANPYGMVFGNAALVAAYYMILKKKHWHILSFAIFSLFALSTASRKALLMIVIGVVAIAVLHYGIRRIYRTLLIVAGVVILGVLILQLPYFGEIGERITNLLTGEQDMSDQLRQDMVEFGLQLFSERPILGYGISNFAAMYLHKTYSHNNFIELLVSGGIIALILYYLMLLIPTTGLLIGRKKGGKLDDLHLMLLIRVIVELVFSVAMVQLYNKNSWLLMGVLTAEAAHTVHKKNTLQEKTDEAAQ